MLASGIAVLVAACGGGTDENSCGLVKQCTPPAAITALTLTPATSTVLIGATQTLAAVPTTGTGAAVSYVFASDAPGVATVSSGGLVTGVSAGTATITVTATATGTGLTSATQSATATITVVRGSDALLTLTLSPTAVNLAIGAQQRLTATTTTTNGTVQVAFDYRSAAPTIATVSATGEVTGVAPGTTTITLTATGAGGGLATNSKTATVNVTVTPDAVQSVTLTPATGSVTVGSTLDLIATAGAGAGVATTYSYASSSPTIASVSSTGRVSGVAPGTTTITVTATGSGAGFTTNSKSAAATITVTPFTLGVGFGDGQFAAIPAGTFNRGSSASFPANEQPIRAITLSAFRMQRSEVTQAQWRQVMTGTAIANPSAYNGCDLCPVEQVSYNDVQEFLTRLNAQDPGKNYRLPTEAEWDYAARAGQTGDISGTLDNAWARENTGSVSTKQVGLKAANAWGLFDVFGNVEEMTNDYYSATYYAIAPSINPTGPATGTERVRRGGDFNGPIVNARIGIRLWDPDFIRYNTHGFRLARNP